MRIPTPLVMVDFFSDKLGLYSFRARIASSFLNKKARKCIKPLDHINLSFDIFRHIPLKYIGRSIAPLQVRQEIQSLVSILSEQNVRVMLEIGTGNGGTLYLFTRVIDSTARIISLDLPGGKPGDGYEDFKIPFFTNFAQKNQRIFLVRGDSHSPATSSTIKSILKEQKLDFLFLDGDHTYEGVKLDFEIYGKLVHTGGLIALHDIVPDPSANVGGVPEFWNQVKSGFRHEEFVQDWKQGGCGIGVLFP